MEGEEKLTAGEGGGLGTEKRIRRISENHEIEMPENLSVG